MPLCSRLVERLVNECGADVNSKVLWLCGGSLGGSTVTAAAGLHGRCGTGFEQFLKAIATGCSWP